MHLNIFLYLVLVNYCLKLFSNSLVIFQVDVDYKLQDMKKLYKELEMKGKGYKRKLDELQVALVKHMEQYALVNVTFSRNLVCL